MGTAYSDIFDSFLSRIKDWRLDALYTSSVTDFETYLTAFLADAVTLFKNCDQSLARDDSTKVFTETLTEKNIVMLGMLIVQSWLEKEVDDVRQFTLHGDDKDFKHYSEAQNLTAKNARLSEVMEKNSQALLDYGYQKLKDGDLSGWLDGTFWGG